MMQIISIKKEENFIKFSLIEKTLSSFKINHLELIDLKKEERINENSPLKVIEKFLKPNVFWLASLSACSVIEKTIPFPSISWGKIKKLLPFQLEGLFPYNLEGFELKKIYSKTRREKLVTLFAAEKKALLSTVNELLKNQIEPSYVVIDNLGLNALLKEKEFKEKGIHLHLNYKELILTVFDHHQAKQRVVVEGGYESFFKDPLKVEFAHSMLHKEIIKHLLLLQEKIEQPVVLSGFFSKIPSAEKSFFETKFLYLDAKKALFALEIGNAMAFMASKKNAIDLVFLQLPKKSEYLEKQALFLKKSLFAFLLILSVSVFSLGKYAKHKIGNHLGMEKIFERQSLAKVHTILKQLIYQAEAAPIVLDLQKQPTSIEQIMEIIAGPVKQNQTTLKGFSYKVVKHPSFKNPLASYAVKIELQIEGSNAATVQLTKDLKKISQIDAKKGVKMEKIKNEYKLELFLKVV